MRCNKYQCLDCCFGEGSHVAEGHGADLIGKDYVGTRWKWMWTSVVGGIERGHEVHEEHEIDRPGRRLRQCVAR